MLKRIKSWLFYKDLTEEARQKLHERQKMELKAPQNTYNGFVDEISGIISPILEFLDSTRIKNMEERKRTQPTIERVNREYIESLQYERQVLAKTAERHELKAREYQAQLEESNRTQADLGKRVSELENAVDRAREERKSLEDKVVNLTPKKVALIGYGIRTATEILGQLQKEQSLQGVQFAVYYMGSEDRTQLIESLRGAQVAILNKLTYDQTRHLGFVRDVQREIGRFPSLRVYIVEQTPEAIINAITQPLTDNGKNP